MRKSIFSTLSLGVLLTLASCDSRQRLSENLQGEWTGTPEQIESAYATRATVVRSLQFIPTGNKGDGNLTLTATITVENMMQQNDSIMSTQLVSTSGTASISGFYQATDDEDLLLHLDATTLKVDTDPSAAMLATQQIDKVARDLFFNISEIEDIKIRNDMMTCEIGHSDLTFRHLRTRQ